MSDPTAGEIRVASPLAIAFTVIPHVLERFAKEYPRVIVYFDEVASASATRDFRDLRDRKYDLILGRGGDRCRTEKRLSEDLNIETLFDDRLVIAAGANSKWADASTQDRSCRNCRRAVDHAAAAFMEPSGSVGCLPLKRPSPAEGHAGDTVNVGHYPIPCRRQVHHRDAAVGGVLQVAESVAGRFAAPAMAGQHSDPEESNIKPGRRAFHRVCPRLHATDAPGEARCEAISTRSRRSSRRPA